MTKPFGFAIHVAVDGYSRKVLWLKVLRLINSPNDIAALYLSCVEELPGAKIKIITDLGTENTLTAAIHSFFRQDTDAHHYISSPRSSGDPTFANVVLDDGKNCSSIWNQQKQ